MRMTYNSIILVKADFNLLYKYSKVKSASTRITWYAFASVGQQHDYDFAPKPGMSGIIIYNLVTFFVLVSYNFHITFHIELLTAVLFQ